MAGAMSKVAKNSLANLSKAFPQTPSLLPPLNVSKLGFISASNYSQLQGGDGGTIDADDELAALTQKSKENMEDLMETTQEKGHEMKEKTKDKAQDIKETTKDAAESMSDKAKEAAGTGKDKAEETAEKLKEKAGIGMGVGDDPKSEQTIGEKARQTVEEMWVVAKDTKDKIKESVVGKSSKDDSVVEDHVPERKVYEDVVESARKVGNLDHEKQKQ